MPALKPEEYLIPKRRKRAVKAKKFEDYVSTNIIENQVTNHTRCFDPQISATDTTEYRNSFFVKTIVDWNHLEEFTAWSPSVEDFRLRIKRNNPSYNN